MTLSRLLVCVLASSLFAASAHAAMYAAVNGLDTPGCGSKTTPCRSISQAIANAAPGDTVIVGPGRYGGNDDVPGDPGDEFGFPFCGCALGIDKPITVVSSHGAAATVIDMRGLPATRGVFLLGAGITFGKPEKGFTVTGTQDTSAPGMFIVGEQIRVAGNQIVLTPPLGATAGSADGIVVGDSNVGPLLIEANQVTGWAIGIQILGPGTTARKNILSLNGTGIFTNQASAAVVGNLVVANNRGATANAGQVIGNAMLGNGAGVEQFNALATITKNNIMGNRCGISTQSFTDSVAPDNYWGASTGPGPDPADPAGGGSCTRFGRIVTATPFVTKPFTVKPKIEP